MQEHQEMKRLIDGDDELAKSAETICPYLKATLPIRTKNVYCTVKTTNSKGHVSDEPFFIYPWGFSQILLNCPDIKPLDIEYFITNIRAIYPHIQIKTIEKSYPYTSTKGNHSTCTNTEKWLAVQEHDPFLMFVQQWKVDIPTSLDLPQHLMVSDAVKLYLYLCLLEQSEGVFPLVEVEKAIANIKGKNQIPAEFIDIGFEQMFTAPGAGFIDRVQSNNAKKIIYVLGRCCYAYHGEVCRGIHAIVLDPAIATELRKGERFASNDVKTAIISSFMDYLKEDPTNALSRKTALNSLRKQLGGDRYSAIKTEMLGEQARQLLEGDGWLKILPDGRAILAKDRSIDGIDTVLRDLESDLAKHPAIWWGRDINITVAEKPFAISAVEEQVTAEKKAARVEKKKGVEETNQPSAFIASQAQYSGLNVFLGLLKNNKEKIFWQPGSLNNGHFILIGGSGAGKTETLRCIASDLDKNKFPVLMMDFHGDMSCEGNNIKTYEIGEGSPFYFNPLELNPLFKDIKPLRAGSDFVDAMSINFSELGVQQRNRLKEIIKEAYERSGITTEMETWTRELNFAEIEEVIKNTDDKLTQTTAAYLNDIFDYKLFSGSEKISIKGILDKGITHINLKPLPESLRALYADLFLRKIYYSLQALGEIPRGDIEDRSRFRLFVIVDEAKLLVSEKQGVKAVLNKFATELRKYGAGLILASQLIDHFTDEIRSNIAVKLCMKAENNEQAKKNSKSFGVDEKLLLGISKGEGILSVDRHKLQIRIVPTWDR